MWMKPLSLQTPVFSLIPEMQVVWIHSFFFFPPQGFLIYKRKSTFHFFISPYKYQVKLAWLCIMWLSQHWPAFLSWPSWEDIKFLTRYYKWTEMLGLGVCPWLGIRALGPLPWRWPTMKMTLHPHITLCPCGELCMLSIEERKQKTGLRAPQSHHKTHHWPCGSHT